MLGAAMAPDVGGVVGADRGLDARTMEHRVVHHRLDVGGGGEQDVDDVLFDDVAALGEEFGAGAEAFLPGTRGAVRVQAGAHVGVLGVGDDEIAAAVTARADRGELFV